MERQIRNECANTGEELPDKIRDKPHLHFGLALYINAWHELDSERSRADYRRISRSSCFEYANDYELTEDQREDLWYYVARMDKEFLAWFRTTQPKPKQ